MVLSSSCADVGSPRQIIGVTGRQTDMAFQLYNIYIVEIHTL